MALAGIADSRAASRAYHRDRARDRTISRLKAESAISQAFIREPGLYSWTVADPSDPPEPYLAQVGIDDASGVRPRLELTIVGHAEEQSNTMYEIHCVLQNVLSDNGEAEKESQVSGSSIGAIGSEISSQPSQYSVTSQNGFRWRCKRRLCEIREELYDPLKQSLGPAYYEHFKNIRFALRTGPPGTTDRLRLWFGRVAYCLCEGLLARKMVETVIRFLGAPVGRLAPKKRIKAFKEAERLEIADEATTSGLPRRNAPPSHPRGVANEAEAGCGNLVGSRPPPMLRDSFASDPDSVSAADNTSGYPHGAATSAASPAAAAILAEPLQPEVDSGREPTEATILTADDCVPATAAAFGGIAASVGIVGASAGNAGTDASGASINVKADETESIGDDGVPMGMLSSPPCAAGVSARSAHSREDTTGPLPEPAAVASVDPFPREGTVHIEL